MNKTKKKVGLIVWLIIVAALAVACVLTGLGGERPRQFRKPCGTLFCMKPTESVFSD